MRGIGGSRLARLEEESVLGYDEASLGEAFMETAISIDNCLFAKPASGKASQAKID